MLRLRVMRAFRHKLLAQLFTEPRALSRNRHYDTFDDADGRAALKAARHLRALERDILAQAARGHRPVLEETQRDGEAVIRVELSHLRAKRVAYLSRAELRLLLERPGVKEALAAGDEE